MTPDLSDVPVDLREAVAAALSGGGVMDGHLSLELVGADRMRQLNREHRGVDEPTDVLAFPLDEAGPVSGPRELGDIVICPEQTADLPEAAVHGTLHLCGYDHETDSGEMLALQAKILRSLRSPDRPPTSDRGSERASISDSPRASGSRGSGRNR